jgi:hypothetical protein
MLKLDFKKLLVLFFAFGSLFANANESSVPKDLQYPKSNPSALEVMKNVYFVNHFYAFKNYSIGKERRDITVIVKKSKGEDPLTETVERYLNNSYDDGTIKAKDLAIFRSGKNRGLGMLITDYVDDDKSQLYLACYQLYEKLEDLHNLRMKMLGVELLLHLAMLL